MDNGFEKRNHLIVCRRMPGEQHDIREYVCPDTLAVRQLYESRLYTNESVRQQVVDLFEWVCANVTYPKDANLSRQISFDGYHATIDDYWPMPAETLAWPHVGDCDACSHLLASLIRNFCPASDVYVVLGGYNSRQMNHAWVEWRDMILETTKDVPPQQTFEASAAYTPMVRYNDREIWVKRGSRDYEWLMECQAHVGGQPVGTNGPPLERRPALINVQGLGEERAYPATYAGRGEVLDVTISDVPDSKALFDGIEKAVGEHGTPLLKQELNYHDGEEYPWHLKVALGTSESKQAVGFLPLIPIILGVVAISGAIGIWQLKQLMERAPVAGIVLTVLGLAAAGTVAYLVLR